MIIDKVLEFIKVNKLTKHQVELNAGLSNAYLANIKKSGSEIYPDKLKLITKAYPDLEKYLEDKSTELSNKKFYSLISAEAAAGFGNEKFSISDRDIQGKYHVPDFNDIDFMIRVKGSSMYPKYSSGDIVACRIIKESTFIQWNKTYVVATREQGILCKRLMPSEKKDHFKAVSDNKEYPPFDIPEVEISGIALIIGTIRLE